MEGIDYAWERPSPVDLFSLGKRFVCRYLAYLPNGKVIDSAERKRLHDAGISIVLNWEQAAGDFRNGYDRGRLHATEALRQANALGYPRNLPIYFSVDENVTNDTTMQLVRAYLNGVSSVLTRERTGVYGQYSVIERMLPDYAAYGWQTYAWSNGQVSKKAHIYQYRNGVIVAGVDSDLNRTMRNDFVAWNPPGKADQEEKMRKLAVVSDGTNDHWFTGDGDQFRMVLTWPEHERIKSEGVTEKRYPDMESMMTDLGRVNMEAVPGTLNGIAAAIATLSGKIGNLDDNELQQIKDAVTAGAEMGTTAALAGLADTIVTKVSERLGDETAESVREVFREVLIAATPTAHTS